MATHNYHMSNNITKPDKMVPKENMWKRRQISQLKSGIFNKSVAAQNYHQGLCLRYKNESESLNPAAWVFYWRCFLSSGGRNLPQCKIALAGDSSTRGKHFC